VTERVKKLGILKVSKQGLHKKCSGLDLCVLGERERERVQREEAQQRQEGRPGGGQQG
jgi:hypothetical protein